MIYLLYHNQKFQPQIEYTFKVILSTFGLAWEVVESDKLETLGIQQDDILISYGTEKPAASFTGHIHIYESGFFGKDYLKLKSLPHSPLKRFGDIPIIYQRKENLPEHVVRSETSVYRSIETDIDIIASSFFMLTRYEEVLLGRKDEHGRFPAKESLAYKEGFLSRPIVNEYIELLWSWIKALNPRTERKSLWPDGKGFAVCITHDVDMIKKYYSPPLKEIGGLLLKKRELLLALRLTWDYKKVLFHLKRDPYDTFDYLLDLEQNYYIKSSFYFMAPEHPPDRPYYSITEPGVLKLMRQVENRGCEVGLHAGYGSHDSQEQVTAEKKRLDNFVADKEYGCRQHGLTWRAADTWRYQEKAGLFYDSSLSFADHIGFRGGICFPFKPFDLARSRELDIWELPLTVMEGSLQSANYQNLPPGEAYEEIIKHLETAKKFGGVFVLLWHNSSFDPLRGWAGWKGVYEQVVKYIGGQDAFIATGREAVREWGKRLEAVK